jgi:hypothetical protein
MAAVFHHPATCHLLIPLIHLIRPISSPALPVPTAGEEGLNANALRDFLDADTIGLRLDGNAANACSDRRCHNAVAVGMIVADPPQMPQFVRQNAQQVHVVRGIGTLERFVNADESTDELFIVERSWIYEPTLSSGIDVNNQAILCGAPQFITGQVFNTQFQVCQKVARQRILIVRVPQDHRSLYQLMDLV